LRTLTAYGTAKTLLCITSES